MFRRASLRLALCAALVSLPVSAAEYRSVSVPVAILYDAASGQGKRLYLVKAGTPLEVVSKVDGWTKVRDAEGTIAWIENRVLSTKRMVVVIAPRAEARQSASAGAALVFQAEKWVALELLESGATGWVKVRHRDGATGFVPIAQLWGL
jgi:SH3-like domain-containing protein